MAFGIVLFYAWVDLYLTGWSRQTASDRTLPFPTSTAQADFRGTPLEDEGAKPCLAGTMTSASLVRSQTYLLRVVEYLSTYICGPCWAEVSNVNSAA